MIYKEIDPKINTNKFTKAGDEAEKQMAFYLKRAFAEEEKIIVLNDLRIIVDDEVAQIDHLIVHSFGFIVIESKSVTTEVAINEYDEWCRTYNGQQKGIPSPIKQAERQIEILKKILDNSAHEIFRDNFFNKLVKPKFSKYNFDILVAVSDNAVIKRENKEQAKSILKAEQITDEIRAMIKHYFVQNINPLLMVPHQESKVGLIKRTAKFLKSQHQAIIVLEKEVKKEQVAKTMTIDQSNKDIQLCSKCKSSDLEIRYGKYGYYFKCLCCNGNTGIKLNCKDIKCKPKLKKNKLVFTQVCDTCGEKKHFYTNKNKMMEIV